MSAEPFMPSSLLERERLRKKLAAHARKAGGARPGLSWRREVLAVMLPDGEEEVLARLVSEGHLLPNEFGDRLYLTELGVDWVEAGSASLPSSSNA